jgi:predicted GTPase
MTSSKEVFTGGLSDPLTAQYKHRRIVLDLVDRLHSYGYGPNFQRTKGLRDADYILPSLQRQLDLPQIAVVGSQSVGKSSLIESISGVCMSVCPYQPLSTRNTLLRPSLTHSTKITLPRAKGTCTRLAIL